VLHNFVVSFRRTFELNIDKPNYARLRRFVRSMGETKQKITSSNREENRFFVQTKCKRLHAQNKKQKERRWTTWDTV